MRLCVCDACQGITEWEIEASEIVQDEMNRKKLYIHKKSWNSMDFHIFVNQTDENENQKNAIFFNI